MDEKTQKLWRKPSLRVSIQLNEPAMAVKVDRQRPVGTATTGTAATAVIAATD